ncbi:ABC transporter ATP-binding protein [Jannaschia sp. CCS1]|uniref:ABC transporter ATP-binding protein n=1 Tax=Jannaschia sp. (strain CCS1) TaxID=290400 RepID=UPI000053BD7E|nr:ABC transporter ATP-binding protein [Jannaschia sp. CCS1]ABD55181.1 amino acid/amide ABC transporter ATP-binding protein 2, HAAT family [Jannaschia sp. CCS1]
MLELRDLKVAYSGIQALRGVSLDVAKGETVALIGPNGAGKSSLLNTISGIVQPAAGIVTLEGADLTGSRPWDVTKAGVLQVPEGRKVFAEMTVLENLLVGETALHGREGSFDLAAVYEVFPILEERRDQRAGSLSGGQQQMLVIGRALMGGPRLLLLDEPSLGLAPVIIAQVFEALASLQETGLTILLIEQNAHLALQASDRAYVIEQGRIVKSGVSAELADDPEVTALYLGHA